MDQVFYCLLGPPGVGKSFICGLVAEAFGRPFINIVFDQIFARLERPEVAEIAATPLGTEGPGQFFPRFLDWFGSVGIGTELYRQVKTKYKYIQRN